jgi:hypothetical protein
MEINACASGGGERKICPAGNFIARCVSMVHVGTVLEEFQGEKKQMNKVRITWELPTELVVFKEEKGEQPFTLSKEFTLSLHERATLLKFLESWRGKQFTKEEIVKFDVAKLVGIPCMLNVLHKVSKTSGKTFADISTVSAMPKGIQAPGQINPSILFSVNEFDEALFNTFPDFLKDKIKSSAEYKALQTSTIETPSEDKEDVSDEPLPF